MLDLVFRDLGERSELRDDSIPRSRTHVERDARDTSVDSQSAEDAGSGGERLDERRRSDVKYVSSGGPACV
jgi:hypothetical protein